MRHWLRLRRGAVSWVGGDVELAGWGCWLVALDGGGQGVGAVVGIDGEAEGALVGGGAGTGGGRIGERGGILAKVEGVGAGGLPDVSGGGGGWGFGSEGFDGERLGFSGRREVVQVVADQAGAGGGVGFFGRDGGFLGDEFGAGRGVGSAGEGGSGKGDAEGVVGGLGDGFAFEVAFSGDSGAVDGDSVADAGVEVVDGEAAGGVGLGGDFPGVESGGVGEADFGVGDGSAHGIDDAPGDLLSGSVAAAGEAGVDLDGLAGEAGDDGDGLVADEGGGADAGQHLRTAEARRGAAGEEDHQEGRAEKPNSKGRRARHEVRILLDSRPAADPKAVSAAGWAPAKPGRAPEPTASCGPRILHSLHRRIGERT